MLTAETVEDWAALKQALDWPPGSAKTCVGTSGRYETPEQAYQAVLLHANEQAHER